MTQAEQVEDDHHPIVVEPFAPDPTAETFAEDVRELAHCYQAVYGSDPSWNEGRRCGSCSTPTAPKKWNLRNAPATCGDCGNPTDLFWPIETIVADMRDEFQRPHAACVVARSGGKIVGGAWGFSADAEEMDMHLNHGLPAHARAPGISEALQRLFPGERVAYQDEIFVHPDLQGFGVGRELFRARHQMFIASGLVGYVLRTKTNPPSRSYLWYGSARYGYEVIAKYPDADERVVMAVSFSGLASRGIV